jgi:hypothetical protein
MSLPLFIRNDYLTFFFRSSCNRNKNLLRLCLENEIKGVYNEHEYAVDDFYNLR